MEEARKMSWGLKDVDRLSSAPADNRLVRMARVYCRRGCGCSRTVGRHCRSREHGAHARDPAGQERHGAALVHARSRRCRRLPNIPVPDPPKASVPPSRPVIPIGASEPAADIVMPGERR